jgi:ammonia channel protein AmtB
MCSLGSMMSVVCSLDLRDGCHNSKVCTGAIAGLVSITAGCGVIEPWAGIIAGAVSAPIYLYGDELMDYLQIDDPVGAFPVHGRFSKYRTVGKVA